ncbi:hypothetical protein B0H14DRAFT_3507243 [Mycena olivaceomarginata]|nr:hypothetical protein B0H14DRAFT_3507243 [Mycena olivaceomarginata]
MSDKGSPGPVTPRRKPAARMSTGRRAPAASNPYVDIEAAESGDSAAEEDLDHYESDFIDDRDNGTEDADAPIAWPRTPSPVPPKPDGNSATSSTVSGGDGSGSAKRDHKSKVIPAAAPPTPMTTRSRAKNPTAAAVKPSPPSKQSKAADLNTKGYQGSLDHTSVGVKSDSVVPGTERGDTQRKLDTVHKAIVPLTINMDSAEHEEYLLFMKSRKAAVQ